MITINLNMNIKIGRDIKAVVWEKVERSPIMNSRVPSYYMYASMKKSKFFKFVQKQKSVACDTCALLEHSPWYQIHYYM